MIGPSVQRQAAPADDTKGQPQKGAVSPTVPSGDSFIHGLAGKDVPAIDEAIRGECERRKLLPETCVRFKAELLKRAKELGDEELVDNNKYATGSEAEIKRVVRAVEGARLSHAFLCKSEWTAVGYDCRSS